MSQPAIHVVMGTEEAMILSTALSGFITAMVDEIEEAPDENETDREEMMKMLSVRFCAQHMYKSITTLLQEGPEDDDY